MRLLKKYEMHYINGAAAGFSSLDDGSIFIYATGDSSYKSGVNTTFASPMGTFIIGGLNFYSDKVTDPNGNIVFGQGAGKFCYNGNLIRVLEVNNGQAYVLFSHC